MAQTNKSLLITLTQKINLLYYNLYFYKFLALAGLYFCGQASLKATICLKLRSILSWYGSYRVVLHNGCIAASYELDCKSSNPPKIIKLYSKVYFKTNNFIYIINYCV